MMSKTVRKLPKRGPAQYLGASRGNTRDLPGRRLLFHTRRLAGLSSRNVRAAPGSARRSLRPFPSLRRPHQPVARAVRRRGPVAVSAVAVSDPFAPDTRVLAAVNRNVDILEMERSHGRITVSQ